MKKILVSSQITGVRALSDRSVSLTVHTKELSDEEKTTIFNLQHKTGWLLFSEDQAQEVDIPKRNSDFKTKSKAQRYMAVLFVSWKQNGSQGKFEDFYENHMEELINLEKSKLNP